jgi:hypothetical protein
VTANASRTLRRFRRQISLRRRRSHATNAATSEAQMAVLDRLIEAAGTVLDGSGTGTTRSAPSITSRP